MAGVEKKEVADEEQSLMEKVTILDFDMLCATVALQSENGQWGKFNAHENDEEGMIYSNGGGGGGVLRMWEGELIHDCLDDRRIALQSAWIVIVLLMIVCTISFAHTVACARNLEQ